jgi:hypothetical protein
MRPRLLSRLSLVVAVFALVGTLATDVFPQTEERLVKKLERKFPEGYCPMDTEFLGSFTSETGHIQLSFETTNGFDDNGTFIFYQQQLDNVAIVEAAEFAANSAENSAFCYFDGPPFVHVFTGALINNPKVPFYDSFNPSTSECAWDITNGATIDEGDGNLKLGLIADGLANIGTSVVISGLTPGIPYVICADWQAFSFLLPGDCSPSQICLDVKVTDVPNGCGPLPAQESTWGGVKSLYKK